MAPAAGLLDYVTYKYVVLKDRRLGIAYYVLAVAIVVYIITEVFVRKGYLQFDNNPQGTIRAVISEGLSSDFDITNSSGLSYCTKSQSCKYVDPLELNWPVEGRAVTIATFVKEKYQRSLTVNDQQSDEYKDFKQEQYYTLGPEHIIIKVDHAVVASLFTDRKGTEKLAGSKRKMKGHLINHVGEEVMELSTPGKPDKITLQELLEAAGIKSLDTPSDAYSAKGQDFRQRGAVLRVTIHYHNWYDTWIGTSDIQYSYRVRYIPNMDYNTKLIRPYINGGDDGRPAKLRVVQKRYAIRVEVEQHGSLGMFSIGALLFKLSSGMGLLALAATIIDTLALYLLPNKGTYRDYVYELSQDINEGKTKED